MKQLSSCTTTTDFVLRSPGATTVSPCAATADALMPALCNKRSYHNVPCYSHSLQSEKRPHTNEDPLQPKINKIIFLKFAEKNLSLNYLMLIAHLISTSGICILICSIIPTSQRFKFCKYAHFTDKETEAQNS